MNNQPPNQRPEIPLSRTGPIAMALRNFHLEPDAQQHHPSGRTATPPVGVRLTLRITLIPTPTGWTVSLSEHFPDLPMIPPPPPPTPIRHSPMLRGGNRTSRSPLRPHRSGVQDSQAGSPAFSLRRQQTTLDNFYSSTSRMNPSPDHLQRFRYTRPIQFLNPRLNSHRTEPSTQSYTSYPIPSIPSQLTTRDPNSRSNGRRVRFSSPQQSNQSRTRHRRR